jgi:hypothetical protein
LGHSAQTFQSINLSPDTVPDDTTLVCSLTDLPDAVGGIITLPTNRNFLICGLIDLLGSVLLITDETTHVFGTDQSRDGFTTSSTTALVTVNGGGLLRNIRLIQTGSGNVLGVAQAAGDNFEISACVLDGTGGTGIAGSLAGGSLVVSDVEMGNLADGLTFFGVIENVSVQRVRVPDGTTMGATAAFIFFNGASINVSGRSSIQNCELNVALAGQSGISAGRTGTVSPLIEGNVMDGAGTLLADEAGTVSDNRFVVRSNIGVAESRAFGTLGFDATVAGPVTQTGSGAGWVHVVGVALPGSVERFRESLTQNGALEYRGFVSPDGSGEVIQVRAVVSLASSVAATVGARLVLDTGGGFAPVDEQSMELGLAANGYAAFVLLAMLPLSFADEIGVQVQNISAGNDLTATYYRMEAFRCQ